MKIKELINGLVSELQITFDEDPHDGNIDIIIPVTAEPSEILGEKVLDLDVHLIMAKDDAIVVSTFSRWGKQ